MNTFKKPVAVFAVLVGLMLTMIPATQAGESSDMAGVRAADKAWEKAYNAGQLDNVAALYDENAVLYPPGAGTIRGRAAIRAFFEKDMSEFGKTGLVLTLDEKSDGGVKGDMGWSSGTWAAKDASGQVVDSGWFFSVSRKVGGKWLYVRDAWNSNKVATPAAASN